MAYDIKYHVIRNDFELGLIEPVHVPAPLNDADVYTKPLGRIQFWRCVSLTRGFEISSHGKWNSDNIQFNTSRSQPPPVKKNQPAAKKVRQLHL